MTKTTKPSPTEAQISEYITISGFGHMATDMNGKRRSDRFSETIPISVVYCLIAKLEGSFAPVTISISSRISEFVSRTCAKIHSTLQR